MRFKTQIYKKQMFKRKKVAFIFAKLPHHFKVGHWRFSMPYLASHKYTTVVVQTALSTVLLLLPCWIPKLELVWLRWLSEWEVQLEGAFELKIQWNSDFPLQMACSIIPNIRRTIQIYSFLQLSHFIITLTFLIIIRNVKHF